MAVPNLKLFLVIVCAGQVVSANTTVCLRSKSMQCIQGLEQVTSASIEYEAYIGIPYAKPPVGQLRFANPVANDSWTGVYNATQLKPPCIQRNELFPLLAGVLGNEDCLYLNVYRPKNAARKLPVMVYIHGGDFQYGSADLALSGSDRLMNNREVILVTVAYRLGALGFLSTGDSEAPGNFGLKDQSMAIRWVRKYIRKFGGDSKLITVFGDSAGAAATQYHMMSPLSRGQFSRAILMSGSALALFARPNPDPMRIARLQAGVLGLTPYDTRNSSEVIAYLRNVSAEQLVSSFDAVKQMEGFTRSRTIYRPVIEQFVEGQSFLHESPLTLWATGSYEQIPWMIGHVPKEGISFARDLVPLSLNRTQWSAMIANASSVITQSLKLNLSAALLITQRIYGEINLALLSPSELISLSINLLSEVHFEYPMMKSVMQHLQHADPRQAPVSVYFMNFTGPYSLASTLLPGSTYPVVHTDDVQYVLRRTLLFPDFERGSPGYMMSTKMVNLFVEFARTGRALLSFQGTCSSEAHCQQIEFSNNVFAFDPVRAELTNVTEFEVLKFWDELYSNPLIAEAASLRCS